MICTINHQGTANQNCNEIHFILVRMAIVKNTRNKCWWGCGTKETHILLLGKYTGVATM